MGAPSQRKSSCSAARAIAVDRGCPCRNYLLQSCGGQRRSNQDVCNPRRFHGLMSGGYILGGWSASAASANARDSTLILRWAGRQRHLTRDAYYADSSEVVCLQSARGTNVCDQIDQRTAAIFSAVYFQPLGWACNALCLFS